MPDSFSVYEAKSSFSMIVRDSAEHGRVFTVANAQRKSAPRTIVIGEDLLQSLLSTFLCTPKWEEDVEKGLWTVYVSEIGDWGQGTSREEAANDLVAGAKELAEAYLSQVPFFFKGGRSSEFPHMLRISLARDDDEVRHILGL